MELRQSPRFAVHCPIAYAGGNLAGVGIVSNLSTGGCKIGSSTHVDTGANLELRIYLTGAPEFPMKVDQAVVRWAQEQEFGVEFITVRPEEQERLHRFVTSLGAGPGHQRNQLKYAHTLAAQFWSGDNLAGVELLG